MAKESCKCTSGDRTRRRRRAVRVVAATDAVPGDRWSARGSPRRCRRFAQPTDVAILQAGAGRAACAIVVQVPVARTDAPRWTVEGPTADAGTEAGAAGVGPGVASLPAGTGRSGSGTHSKCRSPHQPGQRCRRPARPDTTLLGTGRGRCRRRSTLPRCGNPRLPGRLRRSAGCQRRSQGAPGNRSPARSRSTSLRPASRAECRSRRRRCRCRTPETIPSSSRHRHRSAGGRSRWNRRLVPPGRRSPRAPGEAEADPVVWLARGDPA